MRVLVALVSLVLAVAACSSANKSGPRSSAPADDPNAVSKTRSQALCLALENAVTTLAKQGGTSDVKAIDKIFALWRAAETGGYQQWPTADKNLALLSRPAQNTTVITSGQAEVEYRPRAAAGYRYCVQHGYQRSAGSVAPAALLSPNVNSDGSKALCTDLDRAETLDLGVGTPDVIDILTQIRTTSQSVTNEALGVIFKNLPDLTTSPSSFGLYLTPIDDGFSYCLQHGYWPTLAHLTGA